MSRRVTVTGVELEVESHGAGRPLLFLHPVEGLRPRHPWLDALASRFRVIAPHHPGWGHSALPDWIGTVDDLAYLYLDLMQALFLEGVVLVGVGFGGWLAAEIAIRNTARLACLAVADPAGLESRAGGVGPAASVRFAAPDSMPRLQRWLHRIDRATLLLARAPDGLAAWQAAIPDVTLQPIAAGCDLPHWEQPRLFADHVATFAARC